MPTIETTDFDDVDSLMTRLRPNTGWGPSPRDWVFRGQRCACWKLQPSVARGELRVEPPPAPEPSITTEDDLRQAEWALLRHFYNYSDAQGLSLPGDSSEPRDAVGETDLPEIWRKGPWPPTPLRDLAALAQHYGVPTRLLDWTRKPLIAAYFAIDGFELGSCECPGTDDHEKVAIWALRRRPAPELTGAGLRFLTAPRAKIGNLHAQSGLFTAYTAGDGLSSLMPFEEFVTSVLGPGEPEPVLHKFRLPLDKAPELLWALAANFVQGTTVYTGYEAAWRSVKERRLRRRPA